MSNTDKNTKDFWQVFRSVCRWIYKLRSVILAIPVAAAALFLALYNQTNLPPEVGILLQTDGSYAFTVARTVAVLCPVAVTALCLLLTLCSKKVTYPWLISLLSLTLPLLILMTNFFA